MDDKKVIVMKNTNELSEAEKKLRNDLLEIDKKYISIIKVIEDISKTDKDTFLVEDSVTEMALSVYLTAVLNAYAKFMNVEV